jgi:pimeloyl-ACP methyl ester carboxylesterase
MRGPPLLYIPGATSDLRGGMMKGHIQPLAKKFRLLTCDLRNQGETTPLSLDSYVPLSTYVDDLVALVDHTFGPKASVHVVGWSIGAVIALALARVHPHRVNRLVTIQGGYFEPKPCHIGSVYSLDENDRKKCEHLFGSDWDWVKDMCSYDELSVSARCDRMLHHADMRRKDPVHRSQMSPSYAFLHQMYMRNEKMTALKQDNAKDLGKAVLMQETAVFAEGTPNVEEIRAPTLIVHGQQDGMHSIARSKQLKHRMPNAQMLTVKDQGHVGVVVPASQAIAEFLLNTSKFCVSSIDPRIDVRDIVGIRQVNPVPTKAKIIAMQSELIALCEEPSFQAKLRTVLEEACDDSEAHVRQAHQRQELCREQQFPVIKKYGYAADGVGWLESVVAVQQFTDDPEVSLRQDRLISLMNPLGCSERSYSKQCTFQSNRSCKDGASGAYRGSNKERTWTLPRWWFAVSARSQ